MKAVTEIHCHLRSLLQLVEVGRSARGTGLSLPTAESLEWPRSGGKSRGLRDGCIT